MALSPAQAGVVRGVMTGWFIIAATSWWTFHTPWQRVQYSDRVLLWMKWNAPKAACLAAHIAQIGNHRFKTPEDIQGAGFGPGTPQVRLMQATLQNALEQVALAVAGHGAFAALAPASWLGLIPAASLLFVAGRLLFAFGYTLGAPGRALGFSLTMYPTALMVGCSCFWLARDPW